MTAKKIKELINKYKDNYYDNYKIKNALNKLKKNVPKKPIKPVLKQNPTIENIDQYIKMFQNYTIEELEYDKIVEENNEFNSVITKTFEDYLTEWSGLNKLSNEQQNLVINLYSNLIDEYMCDIERFEKIKEIIDFIEKYNQL